MTIAARSPHPRPQSIRVAVAAITATQIVGWGSTFHVPAVLSARLADGTGLPTELVFGGITLMLIVAAAISPAAGRVLDRDGARRWMMIGSALLALGLVLMASARGPWLFGSAWIIFGLAMPFALNQGSSTALVQISPNGARRAIALVLLFSGLSSTLAWPFLIALDERVGWRVALLVCAGLNFLVALPLHALCLPRGRLMVEPDAPRAGVALAATIAPPPGAYALAAITFSIAGMLTWGLPLHMIGILRDFGHAEAAAVAIGALIGPGQVLARAFEMAGGHRVGILAVGVGSMAMMPLALAALLAWGGSVAGAVAFSFGYGLSAGLISIVRAVVPLRLFGAAAYALVLGRLGVPQNIAFAAAPLGFAAIRERLGVVTLVSVSLGLAVICVATMTALAIRTPRPAAITSGGPSRDGRRPP